MHARETYANEKGINVADIHLDVRRHSKSLRDIQWHTSWYHFHFLIPDDYMRILNSWRFFSLYAAVSRFALKLYNA